MMMADDVLKDHSKIFKVVTGLVDERGFYPIDERGFYPIDYGISNVAEIIFLFNIRAERLQFQEWCSGCNRICFK